MVDKITTPVTGIDLINKTNEIIDNLGGSSSGLVYSATNPAITPSSGTASWSITHNLGTTNIICSLYTSDSEVEKNVVINNANSITVSFKASSTVTAGTYRVVVMAGGVDGSSNQWVVKGNTFVQGATLYNNNNPSQYTYSLSSYLPDDGAVYDVMFRYNSNNGGNAMVHTDYMGDAGQIFWGGSGAKSGQFIFPIGTGRSISFYVYDQLQNFGLWASGYRKVG